MEKHEEIVISDEEIGGDDNEDEEGVEMFMMENWDVLDEASGSEHEDEYAEGDEEIDHDIAIDDKDIPMYEGDADMSLEDAEGNAEEMNQNKDEVEGEKKELIEAGVVEANQNVNKSTDGSSAKQPEEKTKDMDVMIKSQTSKAEAKNADTAVDTKKTTSDVFSQEPHNKETTESKEEKTMINAESGISEDAKQSKDSSEVKEKVVNKDVKNDGDTGNVQTKPVDEDVKTDDKKADDKKESGEMKTDSKESGKDASDPKTKSVAEEKVQAMAKGWDNIHVKMGEVEVKNLKSDELFLCLCRAKEIHIDFESQEDIRGLGTIRAVFSAPSVGRYQGLVKGLSNLKRHGIRVDECPEPLREQLDIYSKKMGIEDGHPRDRSLFLKNIPEDTTDLSLKEFFPTMVRACIARKPGGKVVGWAVVELHSKGDVLTLLHAKKVMKIGQNQVKMSRITVRGKLEIPNSPRVQQWLWGKHYLLEKRQEEKNRKPIIPDKKVGRFANRGSFKDNKFGNAVRGRRNMGMQPNIGGQTLRTNMGVQGMNIGAQAGIGAMGMRQPNMGQLMGQQMGTNMGNFNMATGMVGNMGMSAGMGGLNTGMMGNMGGTGMGMNMRGNNAMGGIGMNQGMAQMGSDVRRMASSVPMQGNRVQGSLDRSPSQNRGLESERAFNEQRQRRSTGGSTDSGRFGKNRSMSLGRDGEFRQNNTAQERPMRGRRGSVTGRGGGRSSFDSRREESFERNLSPDRSRERDDYDRGSLDFNRDENYSDHSDYEDYNRGRSRSREEDYDREYDREFDRGYDRPSRPSNRMSRPPQRPVRRRERSPVWDDGDYDDSPGRPESDIEDSGNRRRSTDSRRDLTEKLGVVLSNERQGVQDDRAMVALLQTALDAMQKKDERKSPVRASPSSSYSRQVRSPSPQRHTSSNIKRRKPYDDLPSPQQKRSRPGDVGGGEGEAPKALLSYPFPHRYSSQGQTARGGKKGSLLGNPKESSGYTGDLSSQQYRSPLQDQYSSVKPSYTGGRGTTPRGGANRGAVARGGLARGGTPRGGTRGRGGSGRGFGQSLLGQGGNQQKAGMGQRGAGSGGMRMNRPYQ